MQWMISGVYVWSGIHKLNLNFLDTTFSQMVTAFGANMEYLKWRNIGYIIPIIEISTGVALLFAKVRKIGMYAAITMHIIILFYLIQMDERHNSVVYPWNIALIFLVFLLFWDNKNNTSLYFPKTLSGFLKIIPMGMVWLLPILNLWGYWDHFLSFSFYSGKPPDFYIAIEESQVRKIDRRFHKYFVSIPGLQGGRVIDIDKWSLSELNVPFYPEQSAFKELSKRFCHIGIEKDKLVFVELSYSNGQQHFNTFTCQ